MGAGGREGVAVSLTQPGSLSSTVIYSVPGAALPPRTQGKDLLPGLWEAGGAQPFQS